MKLPGNNEINLVKLFSELKSLRKVRRHLERDEGPNGCHAMVYRNQDFNWVCNNSMENGSTDQVTGTLELEVKFLFLHPTETNFH